MYFAVLVVAPVVGQRGRNLRWFLLRPFDFERQSFVGRPVNLTSSLPVVERQVSSGPPLQKL